MADFSIASQIGGGGGQNAFVGGGSQINPLNMMQLMQTMELQRAAEQRALAGEQRAQALHGPALEAANLRVKEARLGLGAAERTDEAAREEKAFTDRYFDLMNKGVNPLAPEVMEPLKTGDAKFYSYLTNRKATQDLSALTLRDKTADVVKKEYEHLKNTANMIVNNFDRIDNQNTYSSIRNEIISIRPSLANIIKPEFTPENLAVLKRTADSIQETKLIELAPGVKGAMRGDTILGLLDPSKPETGYIDNSPAAVNTVKSAVATPQPGAAAPQTMQFSGMGQLSPVGQQAAQAVMSAFPGARITSGYRSPQKNADVGGATRSYHLRGDAIDTVPPVGMPMDVYANKLRAQLEPLGYTVMYGDPGHLDHVHIQPGNAMNVPRAFSPSVAATDIAAGREPMGMFAPANAMAPLAALSLMQPQNAMVQPQALPNIAPGLTAAAIPAAGVAAPATATAAPGAEGRPVREPNEPWAVYNDRVKKWEENQRKQTETAAKPAQIEAETEARERAKTKVEKEMTAEKRAETQKTFDDLIDRALSAYKKLRAGGYLQEEGEDQGYVKRGANYLATLAPAGAVTVKDPAQGAALSKLNQVRTLLLTSLMGATGMTSSQINSDEEMRKYLSAMSSPDAPVSAIVDQLNTLSKRFGSGRTFTEADFGEPPAAKSRGKAGETPAAGKPQSLQEFLAKAKPLNPNASEADLKAYYERTYGVR